MSDTDVRLKAKISRELGPQVMDSLDDPRVIEIILNADGSLWIERLGEPMTRIGALDGVKAESAMKTIASFCQTSITPENPVLSCELPVDGSRFQGMIPPIVENPSFAIRKRAVSVFPLSAYVEQGIMSQAQRDRIEQAVITKKNIVIVGATGSGKTTLTNAIINAMVERCPDERIIIIEDTNEIQCTAENSLVMRSNAQTTMLQLLQSTMRLRPDRILVGEVRGPEAWTMLKAWNTGHPGGVVTVHANDARAGLLRLEQLSAEDSNAPTQTQYLKAVIAESVDLVIFIARTRDSRTVREMLEVKGIRQGDYVVTDALIKDEADNTEGVITLQTTAT